MITYTFLKIKPNYLALWETWCKFVIEYHQAEAIETLKEELLVRESPSIYYSKDENFVLYLHETEGQKEKLPWDKSHTLNWLHYHIFHACLEKISELNEKDGTELIQKLHEKYGDPKIGYDLRTN